MIGTQQKESGGSKQTDAEKKVFSPPSISLPKGGGAIRGIGEKFAANPVTGTGSMSVPVFTSPGRSGFGPQLALSYDSGSGNGPFGFGWSLSLPSISRKTEKGLPKYQDALESDVFILSGSEDLVPVLKKVEKKWERHHINRVLHNIKYKIQQYRPRIEGLFARIEKWTNSDNPKDTFWRSISNDNITSIYGKHEASRIADPLNPERIFTWLIDESFDDKGNAISYEYKKEDSVSVDVSALHEKNRTDRVRSANRYLKSIKYCNRTPRRKDEDLRQRKDWLFEVIFDYGEHDLAYPKPDDAGTWLSRHDPFSSYRSGFEVRTYRLCQRILMFHHFPAEKEVGNNCLVRSTDFVYRNIRNNPDDLSKGHPIGSFVQTITQSGYKRRADKTYLKKSMPPLELQYTQAIINEEVREVDPDSLENLPYGLEGIRYQWVDLDGEGVPGILARQGEGWFYKRNLTPSTIGLENGKKEIEVRFSFAEILLNQPSLSDVSGSQQFIDLAGDGQLDLVQFNMPLSGYYERTEDNSWSTFIPFGSIPNIDWGSPNVNFVDLTGDGHADILISEDDIFIWHRSLAEEGFGDAKNVHQALDEDKGPRLVFSDTTKSIFLADLSGDGSSDLVRIRNGEVCYWPNLGYGQFGAKVTMDNSPWFDEPDLFDQRRIKLADIDGSGVTDIIYVSHDGVDVYFNQSGNSWSTERTLKTFPQTDNISTVVVADLLGNGTACLIWSSSLPTESLRPMRYIDLMGGQKPHLLVSVANNLGVETEVNYVPSTKFYVQDKIAGTPWITKLPFPVHVVERVTISDRISRNRFTTRFAYHNGYFDGTEREFRGFGFVEQWDTEEFAVLNARPEFPSATNIDESSHVPPVLTKTWFHTGAYLEGSRITTQFEGEYWVEPGLSVEQINAMLLEDTILPPELLSPSSIEEAREAYRALKGSILRQEVYALDRTEEEDRPYSVSERNYTIRYLQPKAQNKNGVFFIHPRETIDFHYERKLYDIEFRNKTVKLADPRVTHAMTLAFDNFGNDLEIVAIGYGRRFSDTNLLKEDQNKQAQILTTYTQNRFTNPVENEDEYRTPSPCESSTYELLNFIPTLKTPQTTNLFSFDEFVNRLNQSYEIEHRNLDQSTSIADEFHTRTYKHLIERSRTLYRSDNLRGLLPLGELQSLAVPGESYKLAFDPEVLKIYKRGDENLLSNAYNILKDEGGYIFSDEYSAKGLFPESDPIDRWWIPSGLIFYSINSEDDFEQELTFAHQHFFLPHRLTDPFGNITTVEYDKDNLLLTNTHDAAGNGVTAINDYRVLQPRLTIDPNGNRSEAVFDTLGMMVGTAIMGKENESKGDSLVDFNPDLDDEEIIAHIHHPLSNAQSILGRATTRLVYDLTAYRRTRDKEQPQPSAVYSMFRETHVADLKEGEVTKIHHSFSYSDGFGREIQKKIQAEAGDVNRVFSDPRWVGSGWTISNNKGRRIRQYEPFFSTTHKFEFAIAHGVSPIFFYDPVDRIVAMLHPNRAWEKLIFDPWKQITWDVNDTLKLDPRTDNDVKGFFLRLPLENFIPGWYELREQKEIGDSPEKQKAEWNAAQKAIIHAGTPSEAYFDTLGRTFLTTLHNKSSRKKNESFIAVEEKYSTRAELDIEGNKTEIVDAKNRIIAHYDYDMLGSRIHQSSMEAGERWMLKDVLGKPIRSWDSRGHTIRVDYDLLRRPLRTFVSKSNSGDEALIEKNEYGEGQNNDKEFNLRTRLFKQFDSAGIIANEEFDFKGNLLRSSRRLASDYKVMPDWGEDPQIRPEVYSRKTYFDALNRPIEIHVPDRSVVRPIYNLANLLNAIEVNIRNEMENDQPKWTTFVEDINYNAKGQREKIHYGNGLVSSYEYDPFTFRMTHLQTQRGYESLQNVHYTYDPIGNISSICDKAQKTIFFRNQVVQPNSNFTYDALYRLIEASGREHLGQNASGSSLPLESIQLSDFPSIGIFHPSDSNAMGRYTEQYAYDEVGNIIELSHSSSNQSHPGWIRSYNYNEPNQLESGKINNQLSGTTVSNSTPQSYSYDVHGNATSMPHLFVMLWDFRDQLQATSQQVVNNGSSAEMTYYVYNGSGQRVRKVTEGIIDSSNNTRIKTERIYMGGFEIYREYKNQDCTVSLERETLHIMDDKKRIALVETKTIDTSVSNAKPISVTRYQLDTHLGSVKMEVDGQAAVISYEEYYPYGSSSYLAGRSLAEVSLKRYRYVGKEHDFENGFYYYGFRYYAAWLGRWISCDPAGLTDGLSLYVYVSDNPIIMVDPTGGQAHPWSSYVFGQKLAQVSREVIDYAKGVGSEVLEGDFHEGESTWTGVIANVGVGLIPFVGQAADVRDTVAGIRNVYNKPTSGWAWGGLGLAAVGWVPLFGDSIKGGGKLLRKGLQETVREGVQHGASAALKNADEISDLRRVASDAPTNASPHAAPNATPHSTPSSPHVTPDTPPAAAVGATGATTATSVARAADAPAVTVTDLVRHRAGNRQVDVGGQRWHLPKDTPTSRIPTSDLVGDQLQAATSRAAQQWSRSALTANESLAIQIAISDGKPWLARILEKQAKGRWVESQVRRQFPQLNWSRTGADVTDPATGVVYDILSGTKSNLDLHARRMANSLFRMITF